VNEPRMVEVRRKVLKENDLLARGLRDRFERAGIQVVSLVSSPGSGKTTLLERLLTDLGGDYRVAALVGDLATENDRARLARSGAPVKQITTGTVCHLDAGMVERALQDWPVENLDYLFIENVGNLVCPSSFDLGENLRLVLVSTTEGEDKPLKYPTIFNTADVAIVTKLDLTAAVECDLDTLARNINGVRPGMPILKVSTRSGQGIEDLEQFLLSCRAGLPGTVVLAPGSPSRSGLVDRSLSSSAIPSR
jgi:hydrogenase nickel incorporation protein HypB